MSGPRLVLVVALSTCMLAAVRAQGTAVEAVIDTGFLPSRHGFRFINFGGIALLPFGQLRIRELGHCFGMSQAAIDFWKHKLERDQDVIGPITDDPLKPPPLRMDSLTFRWVEKRHSEQLMFNAQFLAPNWLKFRTGTDVPGGLGRNIMKHGYELLRRELDRGQPIPIGLLGSGSGQIISGHAVVVYRITEHFRRQPGIHLLHIYDPNSPGSDLAQAVVRISSSGQYSFVYADRGIVYDFFWPVEGFIPMQPK